MYIDQKKMNLAVQNSRVKKQTKKEFDPITAEGHAAGVEWLKSEPNKKYELYLPNITREEIRRNADGDPILDEDGDEIIDTVADVEIYKKHQYKTMGEKGLRFKSEKRCIAGLYYEDEDGTVLFDGKCPICSARYEYELKLANLHIKEDCAKEGLDPKKDKNNTKVKEIVRRWLSKTLISKPIEYVLVPFYYIETTVPSKGSKPQPVFQQDAEGNVLTTEDGTPIPVFRRYVRRMAMKTYNGMVDTADQLEYEGIFGNRWSLKFGDGDAMNAGKEMQLVCLGGPKNEKAAKMFEYLDADAAKCMTPDKIREYVVEAQLHTKDELQKELAEIVAPTIKALAVAEQAAAEAAESAEDMAAELAEMGVEVA